MRLHGFPGGLQLPGRTATSDVTPVLDCPLPPLLVIPLLQHAGVAARACVSAGQRVGRGERIGEAEGDISAHAHAPASGEILAIETRALPHLGASNCECVILRTDSSPWVESVAVRNPDELDARALRQCIRDAGIVGLGGAAFPTAAKLDAGLRLLVLNGVECEPSISCDDALLRERAEDVIAAGSLLRRAFGIGRVVLAIEETMRSAIDATRRAIAEPGDAAIELVVVPARYPTGGERQLVQTLTGEEVPSGGLPLDLGIVVINVATAAAIWRAATRNEPMISRIVTVAGPGVARPGNYAVAIGTPIAHLIAHAGGYTDRARRLVVGGPMMGTALPHDDVPIVKSSHGVLVLDAESVGEVAGEMPCIRCGDCASACPVRLQPQQLLREVRIGELERARGGGLFDCIECGCCDVVCPSRIALASRFRSAKGELWLRDAQAVAATAARERFEARNARLARDALERITEDSVRRDTAASTDAVQAALERARAKRREPRGDTP
jgi:electron transport complex protein RnfC